MYVIASRSTTDCIRYVMSGFCKCVGWAAHMHPLCLVTYAHTADNQWEDKDVLMKGCKLCGVE